MSLLHIDTHIDLFRPTQSDGSPDCVFYHSVLRLNGSVFSVTVAHQPQNTHTVPLASGTNAYLSGSFTVVDKSVLVTATELLPLYVATTPATRSAARELYEPYITVVGTTSSGRIIDLDHPGAVVVDVTAECGDRWPFNSTTIRCYFNRDDKRFRTLMPLPPNTALTVSGKLFAWADGKLAIDVYELRCNNAGSPPSRPLALYPSPFQHCNPQVKPAALVDNPPAYSQDTVMPNCKRGLVIEITDSDDDDAARTAHGNIIASPRPSKRVRK